MKRSYFLLVFFLMLHLTSHGVDVNVVVTGAGIQKRTNKSLKMVTYDEKYDKVNDSTGIANQVIPLISADKKLSIEDYIDDLSPKKVKQDHVIFTEK